MESFIHCILLKSKDLTDFVSMAFALTNDIYKLLYCNLPFISDRRWNQPIS